MKVYDIKFPYVVSYNDGDDYEKLAKKIEHISYIDLNDADMVINEICQWCSINLKHNWDYDFDDQMAEDIFKFSTEKYRTMFLLKWSI